MLDPEYLDRAGDLVAAVYGEIESDMLAHLCRVLLDEGVEAVGQRGLTALNLLAQGQGAALLGFIEAHRSEVNEAVARTVEDAVERGDRDDARRLGVDAPLAASLPGRPRQVAMTAQGIAAILERDNVEMAAGALGLWNRCVAEAVTKVNTGAETAERAVHGAVRRMMREGISTVTYRNAETGRQTVTNRIDVAVRRHVRTQLSQDGMRRTLDVCRAAGARLVEVSSHSGARPSHAKWQGRVYSLDGDATVDGKRYRDFYRETGYGRVDGLGGANCRHSFGPWLPGTPRMYSQNPDHPSGLPSDEVYRLAQGQRRRERGIRQTKRELAGAKLCYERSGEIGDLTEVLRLQDELRRRQADLREFISGANAKGSAPVLQRAPSREWAGDMPRITLSVSAQSRRRAREALALKEECSKKRLPVYDDGPLGAVARRAYGKYGKEDGYAVVAHGRPDSVILLGSRSDHATLASIIRTRKDYEPGTPIRLLACSTGRQDGNAPCVAQRLADELGVDVTAPDGPLWVYSDGTLTIGAEKGHNTGRFITFHPRGQE